MWSCRKPHEQLPNFLPRFTQIADTVYPPGQQSREAEEIIVKTLGRALGDEALKVRMTKGGFPNMQEATERLLRSENDNAAYEQLTGHSQADQARGADITAELQRVLNATKADHKDAGKPKQPPLSDQRTTTEIEKLRIGMGQLEKQLAQQGSSSRGRNEVDGLPVSKNGQKQAGMGRGIRCYNCGGPHFAHECPDQKAMPTSRRRGYPPAGQRLTPGPQGGCFRCGGPHFVKDCPHPVNVRPMGASAYPLSPLAADYQPVAPWPPVAASSPDQATSVARAAQFTPTSGTGNLNSGTDARMSSSLYKG